MVIGCGPDEELSEKEEGSEVAIDKNIEAAGDILFKTRRSGRRFVASPDGNI